MMSIQRGGVVVPGFGIGFGQPGDWYYTRFIYPDDVREAKRRVEARFQSIDRDVKSCTSVTDAERAAWNDLYTAWRKIFCRSNDTTCTDPDVSIFGLGGQMDDVDRYEKLAYEWQLKIGAKSCSLSAPADKPDAQKREESGSNVNMIGAVTTLGITVAVIAGIVYVVPQIAKLIPEKSEKK